MMKYIYKIKVVIILILLVACTEDFEEINIDQNLPTEANSGTLLPSIIFDATNSHLNVQLYLTNQIMQYKDIFVTNMKRYASSIFKISSV